MPKVINLKPDEEITSIVERLWETGAKEVYFITPKSSEFLKNIVALKLLKREADRLDKIVILVTKDDVGREMAKRVGLTARVILPKGVEEITLPEDEAPQDEVLKEPTSQKYESLIEEEVKLRREKITQTPASGVIDIKQVEPRFSEIIKERSKKEIKETVKEEKADKPSFFASLRKGREDDLDSYLSKVDESPVNFSQKIEWRKKDILPEGKEEILEKPAKKSASIFTSFKFFTFFIGATLVIAAFALYFILPKADVVVVPKADAFTQDLAVIADKSAIKVDETLAKIPAQFIKLDKNISKDFPATGQRQLNDKAKGTVTIYNEFSSSPQTLVEKTRFVAENGKVFRIIKSITVPGAQIQDGKIIASSIDAEIAADEAGEASNIGPSRFTIPGFQGTPKYTAFYAVSKSPMTGGAIGLAKVVSQDDFNKAKNQIWQDLQSQIDQAIKAQIPTGLKLLDGAFKEEIVSTETSVAVGGRADNFTLSNKGMALVLIFDEKSIFDLAKGKATVDMGDNLVLDSAASQINYSEIKPDFVKGQMSFKASVSGKVVSQLDIDALKLLIAGKNESQIKQIFGEKPEIEKARILFWPFWVKSVPSNLDKIKIIISSN